MKQYSFGQSNSNEMSSPKFFKSVDKLLLSIKLGDTWNTYFVFRIAVLLDFFLVLIYTLSVPQVGNTLERMVGTVMGIVGLYFYSYFLSQWRITRIFLGLQVAVMLISIPLWLLSLVIK